jgi:hypothetical protein
MLAHGLVDHSFFLVDLAYAFFLALALAEVTNRSPVSLRAAEGGEAISKPARGLLWWR